MWLSQLDPDKPAGGFWVVVHSTLDPAAPAPASEEIGRAVLIVDAEGGHKEGKQSSLIFGEFIPEACAGSGVHAPGRVSLSLALYFSYVSLSVVFHVLPPGRPAHGL